MKEKITDLMYVYDLKTYHKGYNKAALMARTLKDKFEDIGLYWGLEKIPSLEILIFRHFVTKNSKNSDFNTYLLIG